MWQLLTQSRKLVEGRQIRARRSRLYRPQCKLLEDRCLLSVSLTDTAPPVPLVGAPVVWTATATGHGSSPVYQFSVGSAGGLSHIIRDFDPSNSFTWNPLQEGSYDIAVTVKDSFSTSTGESASASYTAQSRVVGTSAVISPMPNPLVALYSAPPSAGASMHVEFSPMGPNPSWRSTSPQPIVPGESTNFLVAGMLPDTTYVMRHVLNDGTASDTKTFTTGALPASLTFPTTTTQLGPDPGTDLSQDMVYHIGLGGATGAVYLFATDLMGNIEWYYDPVANGYSYYGTSLVPGGTALLLGPSLVGGGGGTTSVKEIDLAGDLLHEASVGAISAELVAMGLAPITNINHEAHRLPNGDTAILANSRRTVVLNGSPTTYNGDMVVVLDQNFQVAWAWDPFQWLDTNRLPTLGEGPSDWLHANSVAWSPEDGNLIVSLRSQDWVIKIAYGNGAGDGHVIWRLGAGGDFTINSADPSPWFSHQHDVRYINDTTIVLFDDGNTRRASDPSAKSRGQELVLDENTMQATLVVNADLGNYSPALGSASCSPTEALPSRPGLNRLLAAVFGQTIEVLPDGTKTFVQKMKEVSIARTLRAPSTAPLWASPPFSSRTPRRRERGSAPTAPRATTSSATRRACPATPPSSPRAS